MGSRSRSVSRSKSRSRSQTVSRSKSKSRSRTKSPPRKRRSRTRSRSRGRTSRDRRRRSPSPRSRRRSRSRGSRGSRSVSPLSNRKRHVGDREDPPAGRCLGVFGLSLYTTEREVRDTFERYGRVESCQIVYDHSTGRSRGFCFLTFEKMQDAEDAKERLNGQELDGRRIRVDFSITQRAHTPTPGKYFGRSDQRAERGGSREARGGSRGERGDSRRAGRSRSRSRSRSRDRFRDRY